MIPDEVWSRLEALLDRALDQPADRRAGFLRDACADDPSLREYVEMMIEEFGRTDELLDAPAFERFAALLGEPRKASVEPPQVLADRYRIIRELGQGGMATVYLALDLQHDRHVAVKVLDSAIAETVLRERFLSEIQIAARLAHPYIVGVHDSGEADGLLYFVMPYIGGESLRSHLEADPHLPIPEAVRIATEVLEALAHAHGASVVHRDIKPGNILLEGGHAMVCDFGIAQAVDRAGGPRLTEAGAAIGTAQYMSPEQSSGEGRIDVRSDIYSVGCVLYEMLAGAPPFTAASRQQILTQHMAAAVPSLRILRSNVPVGLERTIERALAKLPADRFQSAREFSEAIAPYRDGSSTRTSWLANSPFRAPARVVRRSLVGLTLAVVTLPLVSDPEVSPAHRAARADTVSVDAMRFAIFPAEGFQDANGTFDIAESVRGALRRWNEVVVVPGADVDDALDGRAPERLAARAMQALGTKLGAGRLVRLRAEPRGDSVSLTATLYDAHTTREIATKVARLSRRPSGGDSTISDIVGDLLFPESRPTRTAVVRGTRSYEAFRAYVAAHVALEEWNLALADSQFVAATHADARFAQAFLWLAQVRIWTGEPAARYKSAAQQAAAGSVRLTPRERLLAEAVVFLSEDSVTAACSKWTHLVRKDTTDFAAVFGLGDCLRRDSIVVQDRKSPTHWSFRTSYNDVLRQFERAFSLHPAIYRSYRGRALEEWEHVFFTLSNQVRDGRTPRDTTHFTAYPIWEGDSLAFVPVTASNFSAGRMVTRSHLVDDAVQHQREHFHNLTATWRTSFPSSASALEAVGLALDLLGNRTALDSLQAARLLSTTADDRLRIGTLEVWLRLKYSLPFDRLGIHTASALADSLLTAGQVADRRSARSLASLSGLLGHINRAARLARLTGAKQLPPAIADAAPALMAFAAGGGPADSLRALGAEVSRAIDRLFDPAERNRASSEWLMRAVLLAIPDRTIQWASTSSATGSVYAQLLSAWRAGDLARSRELLSTRAEERRKRVHASDVTMDGLYPEAAVLASLGAERDAVAWLAPTLDSLAFVEPMSLADVARAAPLVRAMVLRADLASRTGDREGARAWASAVVELWSHADEFLRPVVRRMEALAR